MKLKNKIKIRLSAIVLLILVVNLFANSQTTRKPNVLFIAVDDLKPELGCYGNKMIKTPNIDRIASRGTVFERNYCQQAVCGPTRASVMSGMRPDYTRVWDLMTKMRDMNPDILTLPQYFITQGYTTQGIGKIYDVRCVDKELDKPSWSVPYYKVDKKYYAESTGMPALNYYQNPETKKLAEQYLNEAIANGFKGEDAVNEALKKLKPAVECVDVPDNAYTDGANVREACDILTLLSKSTEPFFFAVGFSKPHLPFVAPKKYWDLYNRDSMPVASFQKPSKNSIDIAYHNAGEIRAYTDIEPVIPANEDSVGITLPVSKQKELIHGYHAAVSFTDAQIGLLLNTLDSLGLSQNTIIVLWGDHGWHLGDHNLWCKHTDFEQATRAPLIISAPWIKPNKVESPSEFVDIFPTICELAKIEVPSHLDGKSLVPLMNESKKAVHEFAVSQYPRSGPNSEKSRLGYASAEFMGYSIRTERYRYTMWMKNKFRSFQKYDESLVYGTELYDYEKDPLETSNVVNEKDYTSVSRGMKKKIIAYFKEQEKKLNKETAETSNVKLLYSDNFDKDTSQWFSEFEFPDQSSIAIKDGKLDLVAKRGATVWFKPKLSGNYMITYDEVVVDKGGENDRVSDMNVFWSATNPKGPFFTLDGKFPSYDWLHLYYAGIGGNDNKTTRFRKYTGELGNKAVIKEYTDSAHLIRGNTLYKIKIIVEGGRSQLYVNDELYFDYTDKDPYKEGYFGFRTTRSHQQFDNFKVYSIKK